jgi:hypothetical protein
MEITPVIPTRQQGVTAGRADARGAVGIGEAHALRGQLVQVRCGNIRGRIVAREISVTEIIGIEDDDVWLSRFGLFRLRICPSSKRQKEK